MLCPDFEPEDYEVLSLDEAVRWLYRHEGRLDFTRNSEGEDILLVIVPVLKEGEGTCAWIHWKVGSQSEAVEKFVQSVEKLQEGTGFE